MLKREDAVSAGRLTKRAAFFQPVEERDADGQIVQSYHDTFRAWVHVRWLRGGESVMQGRLASRSPAVITFRDFGVSRMVTSEWRVIVDNQTFEAKEDPRQTEDRSMLEMLVERVG